MMKFSQSSSVLAVVFAISAGGVGVLSAPALSQDAPTAASAPPESNVPVQTADEALAKDAEQYALNWGVTQEEGVRRLRAQEDLVATRDRLRETYGSRLVGISIEHKPEYRVVVLLTGTAAVANEVASAGGLQVPIVFRTGAAATEAALRAAMKLHRQAIKLALPDMQGVLLDQRTGELAILVDTTRTSEAAAKAKLPDLVKLMGVPARIKPVGGQVVDMDTRGGAKVNPADGRYCTTGFSIKTVNGAHNQPAGTTAVTTAAHCQDALRYINPATGASFPLSFVMQDGYGSRDVQIHTSGYNELAQFYGDSRTVSRAVTGKRNWSSTGPGDQVCHRGETTGYSCATVESIYFYPDDSKCAGYCNDTWVSVSGPGVKCYGGDSGGSVFASTVAFGTLKGGVNPDAATQECSFYYYMSTDFLPAGWSLIYG